MYIIDEKLTKEENIAAATEYTNKAKELQEEFNTVMNKIKKFCPGRTFGLSKAKLEKHNSPNEVYERLFNASRSLYNTKSTYEMRERTIKEKAEKEKQAELLKQREIEKNNLVNEAIAYCIANGRIFGSDGFTVDSAIAIANDIAFNKEVKRREDEIGDGYTAFSGQNCEDECDGWNPKDRRCQCGNRRVSWTEDYSDFKNMSIYAEAY